MRKLKKKLIELVTHDGSFHTDDIFACATLSILLENKKEKFKIIRTRNQKIIDSGDYVFDVGVIYNEKLNKFDHHQIGGAGKREGKEAIEYSSFGLVWKKFGPKICENKKVADRVDKKLVSPIDAWDNGFDLAVNKCDVSPYFIQHIFFSMEPTWRENSDIDKIFLKCVEMAKIILGREIIQAQDDILAEKSVIDIYQKTPDKRIIILDKEYPVQRTLHNFPEPLFVIYPRKTRNYWGVKAVKKDPKTFINRKNFPASWMGLRDEELQKITRVADSVFCHRRLFLAVAKSKEWAIKLAELALIG